MDMTKTAAPHGVSTVQPAVMSSHTYPKLTEFRRLDPKKVMHPTLILIVIIFLNLAGHINDTPAPKTGPEKDLNLRIADTSCR